MVEIRLTLGYEVLTSLLCGEEMAVEVEDEDMRIVLRANDEAIKRFTDNVEKVLLALAQPGSHKH